MYPLYDRFLGLVTSEITLANIKSSDRVLFIGSGPFPITAILLTQFSGCRVICCERDKQHFAISNQLMSTIGLDKRIEIIHADDQRVAYLNCSVVLVAILARPKKRILAQILDRAALDTRIIWRTTHGLRQLFYEPTGLSFLRPCSRLSVYCARPGETISSMLLQRPGATS
jgi:tRNA A58 N-methylase Trm61